jgi:RNA polymerase sigma-70 factor (ECF subfamily)
VAALTRRFGVACLPLVENAVQEACLRAVERGSAVSMAEGLEPWLVRVAFHLVIDALRRDGRQVPIPAEGIDAAEPVAPELDDELRLTFLCCHPILPRAAQIGLTLRVAFGFTTAQIARAFLSDERTIAQRIVRAKRKLRDEGVPFEIPEPDELTTRRDAILDVLYQLFTEGYATTHGEAGVDDALCDESLRLVRLLTEDERLTSAPAEALRALQCFHVARGAARRADDGSLLLLHEQDRARWDTARIAEGFECLRRSARGSEISRFHLEAGIAACHAAASCHASTDWPRIVSLYDVLRAVAPSPVVEVNRALAVAMSRGALAGIDELDAIPERDLLARYPYALAAYSELYASLGHLDLARDYLDRALEQQTAPAERALLHRKRAAIAGDRTLPS